LSKCRCEWYTIWILYYTVHPFTSLDSHKECSGSLRGFFIFPTVYKECNLRTKFDRKFRTVPKWGQKYPIRLYDSLKIKPKFVQTFNSDPPSTWQKVGIPSSSRYYENIKSIFKLLSSVIILLRGLEEHW
jgi:hypothetical protein